MSWFGKSSKVESKNDMESLNIRFETIQFHPDRNEYELLIHLPDCPKHLIKLTYEKPSGQLELQGKKQKTEFVHRVSIPTDCLATKIYGCFRGDVLHIIMPRLLSERRDASSKHEDASSDWKSTEQVGEDRENLPAKVPESLPSDQKSTEKLTERGKDRDKLPANVFSSSPQSDQETTGKSRQRDNELYPEISARQPSVRKPSSSVRELTENYLKNISNNSAPPPPPPPPPRPPPTPRVAVPVPSNPKAINIGSRKEEEKDRGASSDPKNAKQGEVKPENSVVKFQKKESRLRKEISKNVEITLEEREEIESEKPMAKSPEKESKSDQEDAKNKKTEASKSDQEDAKAEKIANESKAKEDESEKKEPRASGKATLGMMVAKVKETGKTAIAAAKKEENRPMVVVIGAAVLALVVIGASLRKKHKN